jgi:hypothetical protein
LKMIVESILLITKALCRIITLIIIFKTGWLICRKGAVYLHDYFPADFLLANYINRQLINKVLSKELSKK